MKGWWVKRLVLLGVIFPVVVFGAEPVKVGVVKGSITIGGRPTPDAVVSVEGLPEKYLKSQISNLKSKKGLMDQRELKFVPRVLTVQVGAVVEFPNNDKTFHNVFSTSEAKKFDLGLYAPGKSRSVTFDKAGVVKILCNVHPSMEAYVVVKGHSYFVVTDSRGNYSLSTKVLPFELVRDGEVLALDMELKKK
ncbi:MAG: hypothetical protein HYV00_12455 [Deltaproteobacteria bacterium]|nr:hypothetical protein [Deltaproteobacteria bacterium]